MLIPLVTSVEIQLLGRSVRRSGVLEVDRKKRGAFR